MYKVVDEIGPEHKKEFVVEVSYNGEILATEKGLSKKEAEQKCAYTACKNLGIIYPNNFFIYKIFNPFFNIKTAF